MSGVLNITRLLALGALFLLSFAILDTLRGWPITDNKMLFASAWMDWAFLALAFGLIWLALVHATKIDEELKTFARKRPSEPRLVKCVALKLLTSIRR